jgi:putative heme-binding domain-containing protein
VTYALIELKTPEPVTQALKNPNPRIAKAALIALDQMDASPLTSKQLSTFLSTTDKPLRTATLWVFSHHPDWSGEVLSFLDTRLRATEFPPDEAEPVRDALLAICSNAGAQKMVSDLLGTVAIGPKRQLFVLDTIDRCSLPEFPAAWTERIAQLMEKGDPAVRLRALNLVRALQIPGLDERIQKIAASSTSPADLRTTALAVLVHDHPSLDDSALKFLLGRLSKQFDAASRLSAAQVIGRAKLTNEQLLTLARTYLPQADALILPSLLDTFRSSQDEEAGKAMVAALLKSRVSIGEPDAKRLQEIVEKYPDGVRTAAHPLLAHLQKLQKARIERLRTLEALLAAGGDIGRGRRIFFGEKVACHSCHTIGNQGGHVGPDLTGVGAIRSGHDILEAIVFPSASFVPGFEIYNVETRTEMYSGVRGEDTPGAVSLVTGPHAEIRIPSKQVLSMKPSNISLMPEGLDESLTRAELIDLLAFLQSQKTREVAQARNAPPSNAEAPPANH